MSARTEEIVKELEEWNNKVSSSFNICDRESSNTYDFADILKGNKKRFVEETVGLWNGIRATRRRVGP